MATDSDSFEVRIAASRSEIRAAQELRYRVFFEEMAGCPPAGPIKPVDADRFDEICDHLIVLRRPGKRGEGTVVGTYRLMRRATARRHGGFYSSTMFDLAPLFDHPGEPLELGRSCIDPAYRDGRVIELLWRGIASYVYQHDIAILFGSVSLPGNDPDALADLLSYLHLDYLAPPERRPRALAGRHVEMRRRLPEDIDRDRVRATMPPLLKGYLRLGGQVGDGAVIDRQLHTLPICLVLETQRVTRRYHEHYRQRAMAVA